MKRLEGVRMAARAITGHRLRSTLTIVGIVIGLALMLKSDAALAPLANPLIGTIIGATLLHEILGPLLAKYALNKAGEIPSA